MGKPLSPWRRGLVYAAVAGLVTAAIPGAAALVAFFTGDDASGVMLVAVIWGSLLGAAGFIVGSCQQARYDASALADTEPPLRRWTVGRCLYLLVVGGLMSLICSHVAFVIWLAVLFWLEGGDLSRPGRRTDAEMLALLLAGAAMTTSAFASLLASVVGAYFGWAIQPREGKPPVVRTSLTAGGVAFVLGSLASVVPGFLMAMDFQRVRAQRVVGELSFAVHFFMMVAMAVPAAVVAAVIAWRLIRRLTPSPKTSEAFLTIGSSGSAVEAASDDTRIVDAGSLDYGTQRREDR